MAADGELWRWPAGRIAAAIRGREVSAIEVARSCLDRIEAVNGTLNSLVELSADETLEAARLADRAQAAGEELGPLHGVPVATKINTDQAGHATTDGLVEGADAVAREDSPQVNGLRRAGAVLLGRSNSPAFAFRWFANNDLHGSTLNPWDSSRTPGGSSGGAASAVASGMVPLAQGNDSGGSIRYPAFCCGVAGIYPTPGRVPRRVGPPDGDVALAEQLMATDGALARTIDDLRRFLAAMSGGYDPRDPVGVPVASAPPAPKHPLKVAVVAENGVNAPSPAVRDALATAAGWLADAGYEVEVQRLPVLEEAYRLWWLLNMEELRLIMPIVEGVSDRAIKIASSHYFEIVAEWWGSTPSLADVLNGWARRGTLIAELQAFLEEFPVVLMPISAEQAFEQDADLGEIGRTQELIAAQYSMMAVPLLGFPALSVPTGVAGGLPTGVQILCRRFDENTLLDAGEAIEARAGVLTPIDPNPNHS